MVVVRASGSSTPTTVRVMGFAPFREGSLTMIFDPIPALLSAVDWLTATSSSLAGARPLTKWGWAGTR